jgi:hypothetical protein
MNVVELVPGNQVLGWMRLGIALVPTRDKGGRLQYVVPSRKRRAVAGSLTAFTGIVSSNDTAARVLGLQIAPMNSDLRPLLSSSSSIVSIHYSALSRLRLLSEYSFPAREEEGSPTKKAAFGGTAFKPYKTLTEISLK